MFSFLLVRKLQLTYADKENKQWSMAVDQPQQAKQTFREHERDGVIPLPRTIRVRWISV